MKGWIYYYGRPLGRPGTPTTSFWCFSPTGNGPWTRHRELLLHDVTFLIDEALQTVQRSRQRKQTHAFAYGEVVDMIRWPGVGAFRVEYNPWADAHFHVAGKSIYRAELMKLSIRDDEGPLAEIIGPYYGETERGSMGSPR